MKFAHVIAASIVAATAADEFYWKPNNNFATLSNWEVDGTACTTASEGDCPITDRNDVISFKGAMVIPDANECKGENAWNAEEGRVLKMDESVNIGALILPSDGTIMLGDDIVMTFDEDIAEDVDNLPETTWKCKDISETNWKCGNNWAVDGFNGASAHRVPCSADTVIFPDDSSAYQVNVPANTFISAVKVENPEDFDIQSAFVPAGGNFMLRTQSEIDRFFSVYENQFEGGVASVGDECGSEEDCEAFCHNHCSELDDDEETQRQALRSAMAQQLEQVTEFADGVKNDAASTSREYTLGGSGSGAASDSITDYRGQLATLTAKYSDLFQDENGNVIGGDADALTLVFKQDLVDHMKSFSNNYDFSLAAQPPCMVTLTGGLDCSGLADYRARIGQARDTAAQLFYVLNMYFEQGTTTNGVVVSNAGAGSVDLNLNSIQVSNFKSNAKSRDIELVFGYSDAEFFRSRYARGVFPRSDESGDTSGFLTRSEAETIAKSLDMGHAQTLLAAYDGLTGDEQEAFKTKVIQEVYATSVMADVAFLSIDSNPEAKEEGKDHVFDQARFFFKFECSGMAESYNVDSIREAFAVAFWAAAATDLLPAYAALEVNKYTSTTTTTTTTITSTTSTTTEEFDELTDCAAFETAVSGKDKLVIQAELDEAKDANTAALRNHVVAKNAFADDASDANQVALDAALAALQTASEVLVSATHAEKCKVHFDAIDAEASAAAGGDLPIIPIAAGAGGVVVILIIVIVVMASKGGNQQAGPKGTSVVAFENPMYDDPSQGNKGNPMYDETGGDGGDEGLYDEPAFNGEADNGGGYLDVEPDDDDDDDEDEDDEFSEEAEESESEDE
jgi:hypothetical protein